MKIFAISDTHNQHARLVIPPCDILIHAGDATNGGSARELNVFWDWFDAQPAKYRIFVPGNHDILCQTRNLRPDNGIITLVDQSITIGKFKIYGSPWQPEYHDWAYNLPRNGEGLRSKWASIPCDTDILITHSPAFGMLDEGEGLWDEAKGCELLAQRLLQLANLKLHVFGHIHEGAGHIVHRFDSVNATMAYQRIPRAPVEINLED